MIEKGRQASLFQSFLEDATQNRSNNGFTEVASNGRRRRVDGLFNGLLPH